LNIILKSSLELTGLIGIAFMFISGSAVNPMANIGSKGAAIKDSIAIKNEIRLQNVLDTNIQMRLEEFSCVGASVVVIKEGKNIFKHNYGVKKLNTLNEINDSTVFRLGSVSKGFAGILAAKLACEGLIDLERPVVDYVPEFTMKAKSKDKIIRIKHLLSHSTGLTEHAFSNLVDQNISMDKIMVLLNRQSPRDSTGKAYAYQNAVFAVIERVIQSATKLSYAEALNQYLFKPLGMNRTSSDLASIIKDSNHCVGHKYRGQHVGFAPIDLLPHYYNVASAGGINSTINDMQLWLAAIMGDKPEVLSNCARTLAFEPQINTSYDDKYFNKWPLTTSSNYGLGWRIIERDGYRLIYHGGLVNGFRAEIAYLPSQKIGIVVLFNSVCKYSNHVVPQILDIIKDGANDCDNMSL